MLFAFEDLTCAHENLLSGLQQVGGAQSAELQRWCHRCGPAVDGGEVTESDLQVVEVNSESEIISDYQSFYLFNVRLTN